MSDEKILSITHLARQLSRRLEEDFPPCWVKGELSGYKKHGSGHHYFTLKDEQSRFSAVLWRSRAARLSFDPADGQQVEAFVQLVFYGPGGRLQLDVRQMRPGGLGELMRRFLELKERLLREGLFDEERKRPLPAFPAHVGLLTAAGGAALRDLQSVLARRWPGLRTTLCPTPVQGPEAGPALARNLERLQQVPGLDLIILGRGGGSFEDLFAFNDEQLARAIAACPVPVISAVGHEVDHSISDMVADLRAPTPSAAAELAVPLKEEVQEELLRLKRDLDQGLARRLGEARRQLDSLRRHRGLFLPHLRLREARQRIDEALQGLLRGMERSARNEEQRLRALSDRGALALRSQARQSGEALRGLEPRLQAALRRRALAAGEGLGAFPGRLVRALLTQLARRQEDLRALEARLLRQEAGERRRQALAQGYAEVLDEDGRWLRRKEDLPAAGPLRLGFQDGEREIHLPPSTER